MHRWYCFARVDLFISRTAIDDFDGCGVQGRFLRAFSRPLQGHTFTRPREVRDSQHCWWWEHFKLLQDQNSGVPAAMVQGGISDSEHAPGLLSLGSINYQIFCVFYRATEVLDDLTELKGKRIAVGPVGSGGRVVAERVLGISGITSETSTLLPFAGQAAVNALNDGRTDAAILGLSSDSPLIQSLLRDSRVRLMSVTRAEALTRIFPFLVRLVLPQGAIDFERNIPASDIVLFSTTNSVLVRNDLHPALISLLAQALVETHNKPGTFSTSRRVPHSDRP